METILQLIPAPEGMKAVYWSEDNTLFEEPVVCLALVESQKTEGKPIKRMILGMTNCPDRGLELCGLGEENFLGLEAPGQDSIDWKARAALQAMEARRRRQEEYRREGGPSGSVRVRRSSSKIIAKFLSTQPG